MEIVTLAQVHLARPGSTKGSGMMRYTPVEKLAEITDDRPETLKALIVRLAEPYGDTAESLLDLRQEPAAHYTPVQGAVVFNIHGPSTQYGSAYAVCLAFPALKAGNRYFKLDEVAGIGD